VSAVGIGTPAGPTGTVRATSDIVAGVSDARLKTNINEIPDCIDKIMRITGVYYTSNKLAKELGIYEEHPRSVGLIAQQVDEVFPEAVEKAPVNNKYLTIKYDKLVPTLLQAIKEQQELIKSIKEKIEIRGNRGY
jgi:hypothetical protein